jgi:uncharacterized protein YndB with AHSA1/START domain
MNTEAVNQEAYTIKKTFSRETTVAITILAPPEIVWKLLTDSANYPTWNSTVTSIEGVIELGSTIKLKSILDEKRTFKLKIKEFEPSKLLVWGDPMGKRTYSLEPSQNGRTLFSMTEKIGGPIFPLFASKIPSFDETFNKFAADLKVASESR